MSDSQKLLLGPTYANVVHAGDSCVCPRCLHYLDNVLQLSHLLNVPAEVCTSRSATKEDSCNQEKDDQAPGECLV